MPAVAIEVALPRLRPGLRIRAWRGTELDWTISTVPLAGRPITGKKPGRTSSTPSAARGAVSGDCAATVG